MQAKDYALNVVLQERQQWVIPVYQRTYSWQTFADKQLPKLWDDLRERAEECLESRKPKPHFVGAIIYSQPNDQPFGTVNRRFLVDGQQRITTFNLVLCALREVARENGLARLVSAIEAYLFNAKSDSMAEPDREQFKLWSSSHDRPYFVSIAQKSATELRDQFPDYFFKNGNIIYGKAPKVLAAYWFLREQVEQYLAEKHKETISAEKAIDAILSGFLSGFQIVVVQLGQEDDAQAIFASLNGNAEPLTSFDLIRNDIFHRARKASEDDDELYDRHWKELETGFWKEEVKQGRMKRPRTDHLITHTVVAETAQDINVGQVANEYRRFAETRKFPAVADEVKALLKYASAYEEMERRSKKGKLGYLASFLSTWDTSAFHPIVLWTEVQPIASDKKDAIYSHLESYILRRDICDLTNKNYNKVVAGLLRDMHGVADPHEVFVRHLSALKGEASRMPGDAEVAEAIARKPLYTQLGSRKLRYIFSRIEPSLRTRFDETVSVATDDLTVEHIMPDSWAKNWPLPSGQSVQNENYYKLASAGIVVSEEIRKEMEIREISKHSLGNLTLLTTSLNPSIGNSGWQDKKLRINQSLLALNRSIASHQTWDETSIEARGAALSATINGLWKQVTIQQTAVAAE